MGPIPGGSTLVFETELMGIDGVPKPEKIVTKNVASSASSAAEEAETKIVDKVVSVASEAAEVVGTIIADSDDGQEQNTPLDPNTHRNYSSPGTAQPFRDDSHLPSQQRSVGGQEGDGAGSPPRQRSESAARDYSHLVEDGMTQDDIRRLEEEERQLDDEIERAGRRR